MFRTSEVVFGFSPHSVESSLTNYALYYAAGVEVKFDKVTNRPIKATFDDKMNGNAVNTIEYVDRAARCATNWDPGSQGTYLKIIKLRNIVRDSPQKINQSLIFC